MKNKVVLIVSALVVLGGIFFAGSKIYQKEEGAKRETLTQGNSELLVRDYSPRLGRKGASIQLVEFLDPECESCREFYPYVKMLMEEYEGKIELVIRYAPFHGNSILVIKILEAARKQNRYWETLEVLFHRQPEWGSHHHPRPELIWHYLPEAGVDVEAIRKEMNAPETDQMIHQEIADAKSLGVRATPTFFINGKMLEEFGYDGLKKALEAASKAQ